MENADKLGFDNPEENVRKLYRKFDCVRKIFPIPMQYIFISRSD